MALWTLSTFLLFLLLVSLASNAVAQVGDGSAELVTGAAFEWPVASYSSYPFAGEPDEEMEAETEKNNRRALFWHRVHYYISYGALSANRVPCPPRSGRSYYTHNCYRARGPVHPYSRGCSAITRCRR